MKQNLNQLKRFFREFSTVKSKDKQCQLEILDKIFFFGCPKIVAPFKNKVSGEIKNVQARTSILELDVITYLPGTDFFRVRKLRQELLHPKNEDFWGPQPEYVSRGRLNKPHEALLYISTEAKTAFLETDTRADDSYLLIIYKSLEEISLTQVKMNSSSSRDSIEKAKFNFFNILFSKPGANAHIISRFIAHRYANFTSDGWRYSSTKSHCDGNNICLRSPTNIKLSLTCVLQFKNRTMIALHYVDSNESVSTVRDENELKNRIESFNSEFTKGQGLAMQASGVTIALKCLPSLK